MTPEQYDRAGSGWGVFFQRMEERLGGLAAEVPSRSRAEEDVHLGDGLLLPLERARANHFSRSSRDSNFERISIRVPLSRSASRTLTLLTGMSVIGVPSALAKTSVNSSAVGGSTAVTRHMPPVPIPLRTGHEVRDVAAG